MKVLNPIANSVLLRIRKMLEIFFAKQHFANKNNKPPTTKASWKSHDTSDTYRDNRPIKCSHRTPVPTKPPKLLKLPKASVTRRKKVHCEGKRGSGWSEERFGRLDRLVKATRIARRGTRRGGYEVAEERGKMRGDDWSGN